jgi:hypothetical protein
MYFLQRTVTGVKFLTEEYCMQLSRRGDVMELVLLAVYQRKGLYLSKKSSGIDKITRILFRGI